ncbi:hypothetical protein ANCCAN_15361 [Ancylostoma caninum]|uniref:PAN domain protein n=1 Tax=Ancylostoma caninum TaxID=29170 RepID=A0A368G2N7_ANCCA|nr:hypothetical protein ANCCAN_15361 [Ancylostoma caninum]
MLKDGCTGAKFDPKEMSCALSYNDKHFCTSGEVVLHYDAKEVTWIHCVNCYSLKSDKTSKEPSGTAAVGATTPSTPEQEADSSSAPLLNETAISQEELDTLLEKGGNFKTPLA